MPRRSLALSVVVSVAVLAVSIAATALVIGQPSNQCDNMAGTCIRERQQMVIALVQGGTLCAALLSGGALIALIIRRRLAAVIVVCVVLAGAFSTAVLLTNPVPHLNNRFTGWLGE